MRIDLRNTQRQKLFTVEVDLSSPPTVVRGSVEDGPDGQRGKPQAVHLNWDRAIDDEQHLRRCPACGCEDLYARQVFPRLTAFVLIALAAVVAIVMLGLGDLRYALIVFGVIGLIDAAVYLFYSDKMLVCYRCHSEYRGLPIGREAKSWRAELEERYRVAKG